MRLTLIAITVSLFFGAKAQTANVEGIWLGSSTFLKEHIRLIYELKQSGDLVSGYATSYTKSDSIKTRVEGRVRSNKVSLKGIEIVYKSGAMCMSDNELVFQLNTDTKMLVGRWKGNAKLNTCPPLVSGSVTLLKEEVREITVAKEDAKATHKIPPEDKVGQSLIRELSKRKYYALIVGINEYEADEITDLDNPISDAEQLAGVLTYHYSFDQENVTILKNPTREGIIKALDLLTEIVSAKDNLLIFYAGHGIWNAQLNQGYWLPSDASLDSRSYWLSNSTLRDYIGGIRSKHTLLISDACFSGGILKERAVFENGRAMFELFKLPSRKAMTSGTLKTVPDESVFIKYLLKNLINNQSPLLSADLLFRNFKTTVINNSPNGQVPQYGPISQAGDEGGDFIFLRRSQE